MDQGSADWLKWRQEGIGASDMPVLFGESEKTPFMLWQEKMGLTTSSISTYARGKGGETEARLRAKYSLETGRQYGPVLASHDEYPWLIASLDGYTVEEKRQYIIEVKFVGAKVYESISSPDTIPRKHYIQCQQQLLVTNADELVYLVSADGDTYKAIPVPHNFSMQKEIIARGTLFYSHMHTKTPPSLEENDWWPGSQELVDAVKEGDRTKIKALMLNKRVAIPGFHLTITATGQLRITKQPSQVTSHAE